MHISQRRRCSGCCRRILQWSVSAVLFFSYSHGFSLAQTQPSDPPSQQPTSGHGEPIVLQLRWDHQFQFAGYYAAKWQGYFTQAGLNVELRSAVEPAEDGTSDITRLSAIDEVVAGRAHFGIGGADIIEAVDQGHDLVVVATIFHRSGARLYVRGDIDHPRPSMLPSLRVGRRVGDLTDIEMQTLLAAEGIDPASVKSYEHDITQGFFAGIINDRLDVVLGYSIGSPFEAQRQGLSLSEIDPAKYGVNFYGDSIFCTRALLESRTDMVERFVEAARRGWVNALENPQPIADRIVATYKPAFPISDYAEFVDFQIEPVKRLTLYPSVEVGHASIERWGRMARLMYRAGIISKPIDGRSLVFTPSMYRTQRLERDRRLILTVGPVVAGLVVLALLWSLTLRNKVRARTADLMASRAQLQAAHEQLEHRVEYRTAQLDQANQQLAREVKARDQALQRNVSYQNRLRRLTSQLTHASDTQRRLIATGLHDQVAQPLALARINLGMLRTTRDWGFTQQTAEQTSELIRTAIGVIRSLSFELAPPELYSLGLGAALERLANRIESRHELPCDINGHLDRVELGETAKITLYNAIRELTNNVVKHANATRIEISLSTLLDSVIVTIRDDGNGMSSEQVQQVADSEAGEGFGLMNIREQLHNLDGAMEIRSTPGIGTTVTLRLPMRVANHGNQTRHGEASEAQQTQPAEDADRSDADGPPPISTT